MRLCLELLGFGADSSWLVLVKSLGLPSGAASEKGSYSVIYVFKPPRALIQSSICRSGVALMNPVLRGSW